jgi:hypothetical protein
MAAASDSSTAPHSSTNVRHAPRWRVRARGEEIRGFILSNVGEHSKDIAALTAARFDISRQAVNKHLKKLVSELVLTPSGKTRERTYLLAPLASWEKAYPLNGLEEHLVWSDDVALVLGKLPENVKEIWQYCFTEMLNNAIDHSGGTLANVKITKTATTTELIITDNGVGVFRKIQGALGLPDERYSVLELAKGKFTTDPQRHSGQGVFFVSRSMDTFGLMSGKVYFGHNFGKQEDWILETAGATGTTVLMNINNHSSRTLQAIFDEYSSGDNYGFTKTVVPVNLAQYGEDKLISRSQAKRVLARVDQFKTVIFDFSKVDTIGQAFADEIFRVFAKSHQDMEILAIHANPAVQQMINGAIANWTSDSSEVQG